MTWLLAIIGIVIAGVGLWDRPATAQPGAREGKLPESRDEAWAILGQPIERAEELARQGERGSRRFRQGLLVGLGTGLVVAWAVMLVMPGPATPLPPRSGREPAGPAAGPAPGVAPAPGGATKPGTTPGTAAPPAGTTPAAPPPRPANVTFTVEPGDMAPTIAARLKTDGLIADENAFLDRVTERGVDTRLRSGTFVIPTQASLDDVIDALTG
ncbi:MAG TPA: hypothetical protein VGK74_21820 [Symbiobacteriaceae bacterium]